MPTVRIEYQRHKITAEMIRVLVDELPGIVAPQMNIGGRELHAGGVGTSDILVDATAYTQYARNVNDIQITVIAHAFQERKDRLDEATEAVKEAVKVVLTEFVTIWRGEQHLAMKVGVSVWLIDMGYATI